MLGITIRFGALQNTVTTPQGESFDLSNKEMRDVASRATVEFLHQQGWFKQKKKK